MRQVLSSVFDLLIPLFDVSTSCMSNATFSASTSHSTRTFLPNLTTFLRVASDLLAILRYFWTTYRILASSMWNPSIRVRLHVELARIQLYANDMVMTFLGRIRHFEKVECDFCHGVRQFKFNVFFGSKMKSRIPEMKSRMCKKGPLKRFERPLLARSTKCDSNFRDSTFAMW